MMFDRLTVRCSGVEQLHRILAHLGDSWAPAGRRGMMSPEAIVANLFASAPVVVGVNDGHGAVLEARYDA